MYSHVITKFSGISRFTYPWCFAGARFARARIIEGLSLEGKVYFYHSVLPYKCSDIMSGHIAILVGQLQHFGRKMSNV